MSWRAPSTSRAAATGAASTRSLGLGSASAAGRRASTAVCLASTATVSRTADSVALRRGGARPPAGGGEHAGGRRGGGQQLLRMARVERQIGDRGADREDDRQQCVGALAGVQG